MTDDATGTWMPEALRLLRELAGDDGYANLTWSTPSGGTQSLWASGSKWSDDEDGDDA